MSRRRLFGALFVLITLMALTVRLIGLEQRPMHHDEANQAFKAGLLLYDRGLYRYDPFEHHGPTLYYGAVLSLWLGGADSYADSSEAHYRIVPVLFGVGLIVLLALVTDGLGKPATLAAATGTALSPALIYYSGYFIQEMLLVFFTFGAIACGWRYSRTSACRWLLATGACLGLMHATKETCVLAWAAMVGAVVLAWLWRRHRDGIPVRMLPFLRPSRLLITVVVGSLLSVILFSSFGTNWAGPLDSVRTYTTYVTRAGGEGSAHAHPWYFYFRALGYWQPDAGWVWPVEGAVALLALVGFFSAIKPRALSDPDPSLIRFIAFYTLLLTVAYCLISYKTPWSMLGFFHGMVLLAGYGATVVARGTTNPLLNKLALLLVLAAAGDLARQAYTVNVLHPAGPGNLYAYGHTSSDFLALPKQVNEIAKVHPDGRAMPIRVVAPDHWPLPWYLRQFTRVYWEEPDTPIDFPVVISASGPPVSLERGAYRIRYFTLRPSVMTALYVKKQYWVDIPPDIPEGLTITPNRVGSQ